MTTVTQKIPNLLRGISQQPDAKKFPGEVRECINAFPEYALGLMKRPGAKLESLLRRAAEPNGSAYYPTSQTAVQRHYGATEKWFNINIDGVPYVGQINDFSYTSEGSKDYLSLQLWFKNSGIPRAVNLDNYMQSSYISNGGWDTHQTDIDAEATALGNKVTGLSTFQTAQKTLYGEYLKTIDKNENIFQTETTYNRGDVYQFVTNGVLVSDVGIESYIKNSTTMTGSVVNGEFTETSSGDVYIKGSDKTSQYPILMNQLSPGFKLYELYSVTKAVDPTATNYNTHESDVYNPARDTYYDLVEIYNNSVEAADDSYPTFDTAVLPINNAANYFVDDVNGGKVDLSKLKIFSFQDTTFILNPNKKVEYTTDETEIARFNEGFIFFKVLSDGEFQVTITKLRSDSNGNQPHEDNYTRTLDTAFDTDGVITGSATHNSSNNTVEELRNSLNTSFGNDYGTSNWSNHFVFTQSGNGIYIGTKNGIATFTHNGVADALRTQGTYIVTGVVGSANGDYGEFKVVVAADGTPTITLLNGGMGFAQNETLTINDSSLGGGGGADITVTVATVSYENGYNGEFELVVSGPTDDSISIIRHEVNQVSELPLQLKHGYKVKIVNSFDANSDDFYVTYESEESGNDYTNGTWVESNGRGIKYIIDKNTMPHALTVNADGSFSFGPWDSWENRIVGDEITNPTPHFITVAGGSDRFIKDMFVYRNRLGFLTEDYVSLSRAGEFFNFFAKSAIASGDDDPIDISVSDKDSPSLNYVSKETAGLLLYGKTGQYLLSTDSDILSPTTAKINKVAGFESDISNPAVSLGATTAFISKTQSTTKLHELLKVSALEPPQHIEQTRTVPELIPTTVDSFVGSPDVGLVSFGTISETTLYHFNYLRIADQEVGRSWYKWELPGKLKHQFFDGNIFHCIVELEDDSSNKQFGVLSFDVAQSSSDGIIELESGKKTDLVLDVYRDNPLILYDPPDGQGGGDKTNIILPTNKLKDKDLVIVMYSNRSQVFDESTINFTVAPFNTEPVAKQLLITVTGDSLGVTGGAAPMFGRFVVGSQNTGHFGSDNYKNKTNAELIQEIVDDINNRSTYNTLVSAEVGTTPGTFIVTALIPGVDMTYVEYISDGWSPMNITISDGELTPFVPVINLGDSISVDGDWRGSDVFIGYKYNMEVELPRIYFKKAENNQVNADVDADLIIHRLKVKTGLSGPIDYKIKILGIPERISKISVTPAGQYELNTINMTESSVHDVPVYQRNDNTTITINSNTAFPATIESINWEGRYATNFYRRT